MSHLILKRTACFFVFVLHVIFLFTLIGCTFSPEKASATTTVQNICIETALAPGVVLPDVALTSGSLHFGNTVPSLSTHADSPSGCIPFEWDYDFITESLGVDLLAALNQSTLPDYLCPSASDFVYKGYLCVEDNTSYETGQDSFSGTIWGGAGFILSKKTGITDNPHTKLIVRAVKNGDYLNFNVDTRKLQYDSTIGSISCSFNYRLYDPVFWDALTFYATFVVEDLQYGIYSYGYCSQEDFINLVLTIINAYNQ